MNEVRESSHKSVLLNETILGLNLAGKTAPIVFDGTFGGGGHAVEICKRYKKVKLIATDQDQSTWESAREKFQGLGCDISFVYSNFRDIDKVLEKINVSGVDAIVLDLGLSTDQLENSGRGFSFMKDEQLLMTMKENPLPEDVTASDAVNTWSEESLADIIYGYGEERYAKRIAKKIVEARRNQKLETTFDLVSIIEDAVPASYKRGRLHFATRTFQALRIAVNDELGALSEGLAKGFEALNKGGRMSVISFHSLEDRIVKKFYKEKEKLGLAKLINKKPIIASTAELKTNSRARSAKLRVISRL